MATFAGYLAAGLVGAIVATIAFPAPHLFVVVPGRSSAATRSTRACRASSRARPPAACGAIAGAAIVIGRDVVDRPAAVAIFVVALGLLLQRRVKVSEPLLVAAAAAFGLVAFS